MLFLHGKASAKNMDLLRIWIKGTVSGIVFDFTFISFGSSIVPFSPTMNVLIHYFSN